MNFLEAYTALNLNKIVSIKKHRANWPYVSLLTQLVDKAPSRFKTQTALLVTNFEFGTNKGKKRNEKPGSGLNLGSLDFQTASFLRFMQAKATGSAGEGCIVQSKADFCKKVPFCSDRSIFVK